MLLNAESFWSKVNRTEGCWLWTAACDLRGYGHFVVWIPELYHAVHLTAHKVAWLLTNGGTQGLNVLHRCDVRPCVRPDHLFLGTQKENIHDAVVKGRMPKGSEHGQAKLNDEQVIAIRLSSENQRLLGERYGVSQSNISNIKAGKIWQHI